MSDPEKEAIIIREHARLRELLAALPKLYGTNGEYVRLEDALGLLWYSEPDKKPQRLPVLRLD
jgi:hypothetical protein